MSKIKLLVEIDEKAFERICFLNKTGGYTTQTIEGTAYISIANGTPYNPTGDLISREQIRKSLNKAFGCENATKYGNQNAEQQNVSYSTLMLYEIANIVEDCCDNAQAVEPRIEYGTDGQPYKLSMTNGKEYERPKGEWKTVYKQESEKGGAE